MTDAEIKVACLNAAIATVEPQGSDKVARAKTYYEWVVETPLPEGVTGVMVKKPTKR